MMANLKKEDTSVKDYEKAMRTPEYAASYAGTADIFKLVYGTMAAGLALTGALAWFTFSSGLYQSIVRNGLFTPLLLAELVLVIILSLFVTRMGTFLAGLIFFAYAALNGVTLSTIFLIYEVASIQKVFFLTAGMFGGLALYGTFTRHDISKLGTLCGMGLWGLVLATLVNLFMKSPGLDYVLSFVGIAVFTGLTMWDAQKIRLIADSCDGRLDQEEARRLGVMGALMLYLDFVNMFLYLLRLFGRKK